MDFEYRYSVEPTDYETFGLCEGLPVRKHKNADFDEIAIYKAQSDWAKHVGPRLNFRGALNPIHNFISLTLPECIPERLEIVSYANEFAFLHDDITDVADSEQVSAENDDFLSALRQGISDGNIDSIENGKRHLQAKIFKTMMSFDRERALLATKAWATFVESGAGCAHDTKFNTLDDYLHYRSTDVGYMFWHALIVFGCAITIPEHEVDLCHQLALPAIMSVTLTNDLFSYEKERDAAEKAGKPDSVINALAVLMHEHNVSLEEAKELCAKRNKEEVAKCVQTTRETRARSDVSQELKDYLYHMQFGVSGNCIWSVHCRRYHMDAPFNDRQKVLLEEYFPGQSESTEVDLGAAVKELQQTSVPNTEQQQSKESGEQLSKQRPQSPSSSETDSGVGLGASTSGERSKAASVKSVEISDDLAETALKPVSSLGSDLVTEPYRYLTSLPSKGVRDKTIDALNYWLEVPGKSTETIKSVVQMLHGSSLMLDDIQDHSQLRRGKPSTHAVFGEAQTINSATYQYIDAIDEVSTLGNTKCVRIFIEEVRQLFVGQSYDLVWTSEQDCPSVTSYLQMVDGKTGGLFRLLARLMLAESPHGHLVNLDRLCSLFGRYFQIRDDYQNLNDADYTSSKGFCEDLDEGKFSLPLIITLNHFSSNRLARKLQLTSLLTQRRVNGSLTLEQKYLMLELMREADAFEETRRVLASLYAELERELERLTGDVFGGKENFQLEVILEMLRI